MDEVLAPCGMPQILSPLFWICYAWGRPGTPCVLGSGCAQTIPTNESVIDWAIGHWKEHSTPGYCVEKPNRDDAAGKPTAADYREDDQGSSSCGPNDQPPLDN